MRVLKRRMLLMLLAAVLFVSCTAGLLPAAPLAKADEITIPELHLSPKEIPESDAMQMMTQMGIGWNLGNTLDAFQEGWKAANEMDIEAAWCGCYTTKAMIHAVKAAGFSTIRIPVSWHDHVSGEAFAISERWLNRVQEIVDWAMEENLYAIVNTHHDISHQFIYPSEADYERSARYIENVWAQIADRFRDYDEHLIFEGMNEPRLKDTAYEWNFNSGAPECKEAVDCINRLNQLFVDTVRASGGKNADRYLMVPSYSASVGTALSGEFKLPEDSAHQKIIVSVHAYTPYNFALENGGVASFDLKSSAQKSQIASFMQSLYDTFIRAGVPVVIGEFGARDKNGNLQDRVNFAAYYAHAAGIRNLPVIWWDNGAFSGSGEIFGIMKRSDATWQYPQIVEALVRYGGYRQP